MAQVTINLPNFKDWRTTLFGLLTAIGGAVYAQFQTGHISWQAAVACALWAIFCYMVPDAKSNTQTQAQLEALIEAFTNQPAPAISTAPVTTPSPSPVQSAIEPVQAAISPDPQAAQ